VSAPIPDPKGKESCKSISLRKGKRYERPNMGKIVLEGTPDDHPEESEFESPTQSDQNPKQTMEGPETEVSK